MKKILYYDVFAGISGDMNLGALVDLGVPASYLEQELGKLNIEGFHLEVGADKRKGISGTKVTVIIENPDNEKHRHLRHIEELIGASSLGQKVKEKALAIFMQVAEAEAKVHGIDIQKVHFHEVGALDSIADIVGAAICQEYLEVEEIHASAIQLGGGMVQCAHGLMPVPAPATAEIVKDMPVKAGLVEYEATTPTGAAILAATVNRFVESPQMQILKTAYGIGQKDGAIPNVLRVYLAQLDTEAEQDVEREDALVMECNIDDMQAEDLGYLQEVLLGAGASDVWMSPAIMKKSRPATKVSILCSKALAGELRAIVFRESSSLGIREYAVGKYMLRRETKQVSTAYGEVEVKLAYFGGELVSRKPEYEQCRKLARENGLSLEEIRHAVIKSL